MGVSSGFLVASLEEGEDSESVFAELDGEGEEDWLSEVEACPQAVHDRPIRSVRNRDTAFFIFLSTPLFIYWGCDNRCLFFKKRQWLYTL